MTKKRLGRGLSSILQDVEIAYKRDSYEVDEFNILELDVENINPNPYQPRKYFDKESIDELALSIKQHGLLQPIVVIKKDDGYMLIAGERRLRAVKSFGGKKIKAIVADLQSQNLRELALIENIQRENLSPLELAQTYKELILEYGITQDALSSIIHKSRTQIANTMRLLSLSDYTKNLLIAKSISQGHAKILVGLDEKDEKRVVDTIILQKLSVRESEDIIKRFKAGDKKALKKKKMKRNIKTLNFAFNKVKNLGFNSKKKGNSIIIEFKDNEEIDKFMKYFDK